MAPHLSMESPSIESPARELAGSWRHYALAPIVSPPFMGVISPYVDYYILGAIRAPSWLCIYLFRETERELARVRLLTRWPHGWQYCPFARSGRRWHVPLFSSSFLGKLSLPELVMLILQIGFSSVVQTHVVDRSLSHLSTWRLILARGPSFHWMLHSTRESVECAGSSVAVST